MEEKEYQKQYRERNREQISRQRKQYRIENKDSISSWFKKHYLENRKEKLEYQRMYRIKNREIISAQQKQYGKKNRKNITSYFNKKLKTDIQFRLGHSLRNRLRMSLKQNIKRGSAVRDLGCTITELKFYLEGKFTNEMSWENYGEWHIDHILPLSCFDLTDRKQFLEACHYTNLQPLWAVENLRKNKRIINLVKNI